jgi:hypothetical protein
MGKVSQSRDLVVVDRRHSALALREVTVAAETTTYDVADSLQRANLSRDLFSIVESIFSKIPEKRIYLHDEKDYLLDAIHALRENRNAAIIFVHREAIQKHLNKLPAILDEILLYSAGGRKMHQELFITWNLRGYIRKLKSLLNRPFSHAELDKVGHGRDGLTITLSGEFSHLGLDASNPVSQRRNNNQRNEAAKKEAEVQQDKIVLESWLSKISSNLLSAYRETEDIFNEAASLASSPEDEYFLEQVNADYYPHIFDALGKFDSENADFDTKELVVVESIKQFRIIQLGLQKIIDNTVAQNLASIQSQTDFLRNKVLGERSFSLTPGEAEIEIDNSVEESQRLREELYKKHVAPMLEKNRQEYEKALTEANKAHETALFRERNSSKADLMNMKRTYASEVSKYKNQASDYKEKYTSHLKSAENYHHRQMQNLQQDHNVEMRLLRKQANQSAQTAQRLQDALVNLQEEVLALKMALVHQQEMVSKKQSADQIEELIHRQGTENSEDFNAAKAELYESPAYYHKASREELCEIYEDDDWYDYEHF